MFQTESFRRGISYSVLLNVVAKVFGFAQSLAIAYYFGSRQSTDVFFLSFSLASFLAIFVSMLNSAAIIPEAMRLERQGSSKQAQSFINFFLYGYTVLSIALIIVFMSFPVDLLRVFSQFPESVLREQKSVITFTLGLCSVLILTQYLVEVLTSYKYFVLSMLSSIVTNILCVVFIFFAHDTLGVLSIVVGFYASAILQIISLVWILQRDLHWTFDLAWPVFSTQVKKNIFFGQLGNIFSVVGGYAPQYILSGLSMGVITGLNFAQRVGDLPTTIVTGQISLVSGIKLNGVVAENKHAEISRVFVSSAKLLVFVLAPISAIFFFYSEPIIALLFYRGAFSYDAVIIAKSFLQFLALAFPFFGVFTIGQRLFMAGQLNAKTFWYQAANNVLLVILIFVLARSIGYLAYPIALAVITLTNTLVNGLFVKRYFPFIKYSKVLWYAIGVMMLNYVAAQLFYLGLHAFAVKPLYLLALACALQAGIIFLFTVVFSLNADVKEIVVSVFGKVRTRKGK